MLNFFLRGKRIIKDGYSDDWIDPRIVKKWKEESRVFKPNRPLRKRFMFNGKVYGPKPLQEVARIEPIELPFKEYPVENPSFLSFKYQPRPEKKALSLPVEEPIDNDLLELATAEDDFSLMQLGLDLLK